MKKILCVLASLFLLFILFTGNAKAQILSTGVCSYTREHIDNPDGSQTDNLSVQFTENENPPFDIYVLGSPDLDSIEFNSVTPPQDEGPWFAMMNPFWPHHDQWLMSLIWYWGITANTPYNFSITYTTPYEKPDLVFAWDDWNYMSTCEGVANNTQSGTDVQVNPNEGVNITFSTVTEPGNTSAAIANTGVYPLPANYIISGTPSYYDIVTTASYSGTINVCLPYDFYQNANPDLARLLHYENGSWVDITTSNDTINRVICGQTNSLSPFVVAQSLYTFIGFKPPVHNYPTVNRAIAGRIIPIRWSIKDINGNYIGGLDTIASYGYSEPISCDGPVSDISEYSNDNPVILWYSKLLRQFILISRTEKSWKGSCRMFTLNLNDGTTHQAIFQFK